MGFKVVIPARFASSRLPGKPLRLLAGRPMIAQVCARAAASGADEVVVATDDERILQAVTRFGGQACLTRPDHTSGTDRIEEVCRSRGWDDEVIVVNLQGDEPLMPPQLLRQVARALAGRPQAAMATLSTPVVSEEELLDPNVVKVVCDRDNRALLFSRAPIPWNREAFHRTGPATGTPPLHARHIGLYAYRVGFLRRFVTWPPCGLETAESLEQLRALWNGETIYVEQAQTVPGHGVDTEEDLAAAEKVLGDRFTDPAVTQK